MRKRTPEPTCPVCGYSILGIRDMRCPECGRKLDVRDFDLDSASRGDIGRYERNTALGGMVGTVIVAFLLFCVVMFLAYCVRHRTFTRLTVYGAVLAAILGMWLALMLSRTGASSVSWYRSWRKRR